MIGSRAFCVEWKVSERVGYREATCAMQQRVEHLACQKPEKEHGKEPGKEPGKESEKTELIWLLEHPPLVSLGRLSKPDDILPENNLPVVHTSRGGQTTCHAPGQEIVYFALDLRKRSLHIRAFVEHVGAWICETLACWEIAAHADRKAVGVWVGEKKIAAMGFRVSRGIVSHGIALNRAMDLSLYRGIVACGLGGEEVVTSMEREGVKVSREELGRRLKECCPFL